jgi:hypothetical protein
MSAQLRPRALQAQHEKCITCDGGVPYDSALCCGMWLNIRCSTKCEHGHSRCSQHGHEADDIAGSVGTMKWCAPHFCTPQNGAPDFTADRAVRDDEALLSYVAPGQIRTLKQLLRGHGVDPASAKVCVHLRDVAHAQYTEKHGKAPSKKADLKHSKPITRMAKAVAAAPKRVKPSELKRMPRRWHRRRAQGGPAGDDGLPDSCK